MQSETTTGTASKWYSRRWLQYAATLTATLSMFASGMHFVWASPTLPKLYANDSAIPTTREQGAWLASISLIADVPGAPLGAFSAEYFGRRNAILFTVVPYLIAWIMIAFANSLAVLLVARFIVGVGDGSTYTILPMYIGEIAEDDVRGRLGNSITMMMDFGAVFIYSVGPFVSIRTMALVAAVIPVLMLLTFGFMPETPYYLLMKRRPALARRSLQRLRGTTDVEDELEEMTQVVRVQMQQTSSFRELFTSTSNLKALWIVLGLKTFQQLCGVSAFLVYSELIFEEAGGSVSAAYAAIIFGSVQFAFSLISTLIVDHVGRKPLLFTSLTGCCLALVVQGSYFYMKHVDADVSQLGWVPVGSMLVFIIMYSVGLGTIPMMMPSEMFPTNVKAKALCVMDLYLAMVAFFITLFYQAVANAWGSHVPFFTFAICCVFGFVFTVFYVPETKGRSLEEIQDMMKGINREPEGEKLNPPADTPSARLVSADTKENESASVL